MRESLVESVVAEVTEALRRIDLETVRAAYWRQDEFVYLERCLPLPLVERFLAEVECVRPAVHRVRVPGRKKSGSVSYHVLCRQAPAIVTLYRTPAFIDFLAAVTGRSLMLCPERDPHSCALYVYTEPGDFIRPHYDRSFYEGARFTVLLGLVNRTRSTLACELFRGDEQRAPVELQLATEPGTLVIFNGDKLWHWVTPLGENEERVVLTMEYLTALGMNPFKRFISDMKDAVSYFGFREVFGR